jgi:hypothetical protein
MRMFKLTLRKGGVKTIKADYAFITPGNAVLFCDSLSGTYVDTKNSTVIAAYNANEWLNVVQESEPRVK